MKKHPVLIAILGICAVVLVIGVVLSVMTVAENASKSATIDKQKKTLVGYENRVEKPALTKENVELGEANGKALQKAELLRLGVMQQPSRLDGLISSFGQFSSALTESRQGWSELCNKEDVLLSDLVADWGFSRYGQKNPETAPDSVVHLLSTEAKVIDAIIRELVAARGEFEKAGREAGVLSLSQRPQLAILEIQREAVEVDDPQSRTNSARKDEIVIQPVNGAEALGLCQIVGEDKGSSYISLRRKGAVNALAFRIKVATESGVLRNFMRNVGKYPLYVRDVSADTLKKGELPKKRSAAPAPVEEQAPQPAPAAQNPFAIFSAEAAGPGAAPTPAAPKRPERVVVIPADPEVFTIVFEYTMPEIKAKKKDAAPKAEDKKEKPSEDLK
ncbi:MAG: Amuc_1100 family pilus-like protein [Opitutae bacterium]|nr:Amuc_1100 family pilus-like protein [Opitutae bacterium]